MLLILRPLRSPLFPYTTLFRSRDVAVGVDDLHLLLVRERGARAVAEWPRTVLGRCRRGDGQRSEEHTSELQSLRHLVCRLLLEKKKNKMTKLNTTIQFP